MNIIESIKKIKGFSTNTEAIRYAIRVARNKMEAPKTMTKLERLKSMSDRLSQEMRILDGRIFAAESQIKGIGVSAGLPLPSNSKRRFCYGKIYSDWCFYLSDADEGLVRWNDLSHATKIECVTLLELLLDRLIENAETNLELYENGRRQLAKDIGPQCDWPKPGTSDQRDALPES